MNKKHTPPDKISKERLNSLKREFMEEEIDEYVEELHELYKILEWEWVFVRTHNSYRIPSPNDIRNRIIKLLSELDSGFESRHISTGGIEVGYEKMPDDEWKMTVSFSYKKRIYTSDVS